MPVANADPQGIDARQHVELGDGECSHRVEPDRVAQRDQVEPAAAPGTARGGAHLTAALAECLAEVVIEFGREGTRADTGRVSLGDTPDLVDVPRSDSGADAGRAGDRV